MSTRKQTWEALVQKWDGCKNCAIGEHAKWHVFGKGSLFPEVVFVGEGPGKFEDLQGQPFVGVAGQLLSIAIFQTRIQAKCFFTNLVACRPCDRIGSSNRPPSDQEIANCSERFRETVAITKPKVLALLGRVPQAALAGVPWTRQYRVFCLEHPAYIVRQGGVSGLAYKKYVVKLKEVLNAAIQPTN